MCLLFLLKNRRNFLANPIIGRGLSGIEPLHVTAMAEQVPIQREAAAAFLVTQLHPAVLGKKDT